MKVSIKKGKAEGVVLAPPSKSAAHRYLICAALAGKGKISNIAFSKDIEATLNCLKSLGAQFNICGNTVEFFGGLNPQDNITLDCFESGSTLRFFIPIALCFNKKIKFIGSSRLFERPLSVYEDIAKEQGFLYEKNGSSLIVCGALKCGEYKVAGDISSQFITGLMFALSLLGGENKITLTSSLQSGSYIDMTIDALSKFGINIGIEEDIFIINGSDNFLPNNLAVEGDYSNAAFFHALNYVGCSVQVQGLDSNSLQGDKVYCEYFEKLIKGNAVLSLADCPDLAPVLMAVAAANKGGKFIHTKRLKIKESDRGNAMREELEKFGAKILVEDDYIEVFPCELHTPKETLKSHNDHRIVMALSVLCTRFGGEIEDAQAVEKSMPDFFEKLESINIEVEKWN